jgi:hypothetical protein
MALHKIIEHASEDEMIEDDEDYSALPVHDEDNDFDSVSEILFEDHDVLMLYETGPIEQFALGQVDSAPLTHLQPTSKLHFTLLYCYLLLRCTPSPSAVLSSPTSFPKLLHLWGSFPPPTFHSAFHSVRPLGSDSSVLIFAPRYIPLLSLQPSFAPTPAHYDRLPSRLPRSLCAPPTYTRLHGSSPSSGPAPPTTCTLRPPLPLPPPPAAA